MNKIDRKYIQFLFLLFLFGALSTRYVSAQNEGGNIQVEGTVTDDEGLPIAGANVLLKGTQKGTITDVKGMYSLQAPANGILVFSFVGYETIERPVGNMNEVNISLRSDTKYIDDVVVVGYSTVRKANLTGAVEAIKGSEIATKPTAQTSSALVGMIPGLTAIQSSGQPGDDQAQLVIRGIGSLSASNTPLVLIDGVEGDINRINPQDIEDMSVLKDAASAAIYGSRASNGVILITTKRAKQEGIQLKYADYFGWQSTDYPEFVDAPTYMKYMGYNEDDIAAYREGIKTDPDLYPNSNWTKALFSERGFMQNHDLGLTSGSQYLDMAASLSYIQQNGNVANFKYDRINGRINSDFKIHKRFTVSLDVGFYKSVRESPTWLIGGASAAAALSRTVRQAYRLGAIYPIYHSDGSYGDGFTGMNPVAMAHDGGITALDEKNLRATLKAVYKPIDDLTITALYAPDMLESHNHMHQKQYTTILDWTNKSTRLYPDENGLKEIYGKSNKQSSNVLVNYDKKLADHYIGVLGGMEIITENYRSFNAYRKNFTLIDYDILDAGSSEGQTTGGSATEWALMSFFSRLNYSYKDRYLLEGTLRRDGSSRFHTDNRWAVFPSVSGAWRISQESFMQGQRIISDLKIRASWGRLGNQMLGDNNFPYTASIILGSGNYMFNDKVVTGAMQSDMANKGLKWEVSETSNVGIDAAFLKNRLTVSGNWFVRHTSDLLLRLPVSSVVGYNAPFQNAGEIKNAGWELTTGWNDNIGDFQYNVKFNISDVRNRVTNLSGVGPIIEGSKITQEGSAIGMIYGYLANGLYRTADEADAGPIVIGSTNTIGDVRLVNQNPDEDNVINNLDRIVIGDPFPRYSYGINVGGYWQGFDFSIYFDGVGKRDVLLTGDLVQPLVNNGNVSQWYERNAWSEASGNAKYPRISNMNQSINYAASTLWVFNASYLRLRNVAVGYTLSEKLIKNKMLNNLRVYFAGMNLFTTSNLPDGVDPTIPNDNNGGDIYPITSTYTFGLEFKF